LDSSGAIVTVAPGRGFSVGGQNLRMTAYVDDKFIINIDGAERESLQNQFNSLPGKVDSAEFSAKIVSETYSYKVALTEMQKQWLIGNLREWDLRQENLNVYTLDSDILDGSVIVKDYYGFNLLTPAGEKIQLNDSQQEKVKNMMCSSSVQVTHDDIKLSSTMSCNAE